MACPKCKKNTCCCSASTVIRYNGPNIPELGISTGDLIEVVVQNITNYIIEGVATSTLTYNGDGTYTHTPGDESGTSTTFVTGQHTTGLTPHSNPKYGDTWYDTTTGQLRWYTNNGTSDVWETATAATPVRFKEETIHHNGAGSLSIDPAIHSKREIHFESTGDADIDGNDHLALDDYTYLFVNTTAVNRTITFANVTGAWVRDGGPITEVSGTGFVVPANASMLVTVTNSGGTIYVNGHPFALEVSGDPTNVSSSIISLVALTPYVLNVPTMANLESILVLDNTGRDITNAIYISVAEPNITLESNVALANIEVRTIYST